ncbi:hypothetical protein F4780DRAFT_779619 [Xylariomycetidae sp. FL0641]|nr:hypothetical protein F4780DRAFT_779619 [Xylariomycetidae sp. FL0641]
MYSTHLEPRLLPRPEVSEYMVRRLDGHIHPALNGSPESGVVYDGTKGQWVAENDRGHAIDFEAVYHTCVVAQNSLVATANRLISKRKLPYQELPVIRSWTEVETSLLSACGRLGDLSSKAEAIPSGAFGKLKKGFRKLCDHAGAGISLAKVLPSDHYLSILGGGLTIIFTALQKTSVYRREILVALAEIPFTLQDYSVLVDLHSPDEEMHRRVASLYRALFSLTEVIMQWYLKSSFTTGFKILIDPPGFAEDLKSRSDDVKLAAERLKRHSVNLSYQKQNTMLHQSDNMLYMQNRSTASQESGFQKTLEGLNDIKRLMSHLHLPILEQLEVFLHSNQLAVEDRVRSSLPSRTAPAALPPPAPTLSTDDFLALFSYTPSLILSDSAALCATPSRAGFDFDEQRARAIQTHPSFGAFLVLSRSSLLLLNANSASATSTECSVVSARVYQRARELSAEARGTLIPLAYFHSRHRGRSAAAVLLSLLLQLVDGYRGNLDPDTIVRDLDPADVDSVGAALGALLARLPRDVLVLLVADGVRARRAVGCLVRAFRAGHAATLKFLFAGPGRAASLEDLFAADERLTLPASLPAGVEGYGTAAAWRRLVGRFGVEDGDT